jgi:PadR family transcriptional regulator, regulatory protein AphA
MISIEFAILGLLSLRPMTGYEIKKIFAASDILYWSGNNNQVYTTLVKLHQNGWVTQEIELRSDSPSRKIYTISPTGRDELRRTLRSEPELPQCIHPFLIQLSWADLLDESELDTLLAKYEEEMRVQVSILQTRTQSKNTAPFGSSRDASVEPLPARTPREAIIWDKIQENWISFYHNELKWVRELRAALHPVQERKEE